MHIIYYFWIHKFHFSIIFSLKMNSMVLFIYLKIILLQYFSIFNYNFQFLAVPQSNVKTPVKWRLLRLVALLIRVMRATLLEYWELLLWNTIWYCIWRFRKYTGLDWIKEDFVLCFCFWPPCDMISIFLCE